MLFLGFLSIHFFSVYLFHKSIFPFHTSLEYVFPKTVACLLVFLLWSSLRVYLVHCIILQSLITLSTGLLLKLVFSCQQSLSFQQGFSSLFLFHGTSLAHIRDIAEGVQFPCGR